MNDEFLQAKHDKIKYKVFTGWTIWRNLTTEKEEAYGDPEMFEISYFSERETPLLGSELWEPFV